MHVTESDDWTCDVDGRMNSSLIFLDLVNAVEDMIRGNAHALIRGNTESVARLIVAQLAHKYDLAPRGRYRG